MDEGPQRNSTTSSTESFADTVDAALTGSLEFNKGTSGTKGSSQSSQSQSTKSWIRRFGTALSTIFIA